MGRSLPRAFYLLLAAALIAGNILVWQSVFAPRGLSVEVLPVGKGSALLVRAGERTLLVDAGGDASILRAIGERIPPWQRSFDALILTGLSSKEAGGAKLFLDRYRTPLVVRPKAQGSRAAETAFGEATRGSRLIYGEQGMRLQFGSAYADILWPPKTETPLSGYSSGLALLISDGTRSYLIYENLPIRIVRTFRLPEGTLVLSSTTPASP